MEIGIDSFAALQRDPASKRTAAPADRLERLVEEIVAADEAGLDAFGLGEHHRADYLDSAPAVILAAAATQTKSIKLTTAVTVLSAADPVRVFQEYATLDLISRGRVELTVGRGSFTEAFPLFGYRLQDYDELFTEKLGLLLALNSSERVEWKGKFRAALHGEGVYPRPFQPSLPIWLGVGGTPASFVRAGRLGLPLMVAIIGGTPDDFAPLVALYRRSGEQAGFGADRLKVGIHAFGYCAPTDEQAVSEFFPGYADGMDQVGRERGWPAMTRQRFEAMRSERGSLVVGSPETVVRKIKRFDEVLGGISRFDFQMSPAALRHQELLAATALIGSEVRPQLQLPATGAAG